MVEAAFEKYRLRIASSNALALSRTAAHRLPNRFTHNRLGALHASGHGRGARAHYSLNRTLATWSSLLVEMSGVKSTRGPTRV
jgi:hypothetical protein